MKSMLILSFLATMTPSSAFSLMGIRPEFCSGTASTYKTPTRRILGIQGNYNPQEVSSSRLSYRNGHDNEQKQQAMLQTKTSNTRKRKTSFIQKSSFVEDPDETSKKVDEYLEFLDRRYNRLHNIETTQPKKHFPVLNWLFHEDETVEAAADTDENRSNALYALGVAGLASERLLQKQGVTLRKCSIVQPTIPSDAIDCELENPNTKTETGRMPMLLINKIVAAFTAKWVSFHRQVTTRQRLLSRTVSRKSHNMAKSALASIPTSSATLIKTVWESGGGKHTIKFAAATLCFLLLHIAKPLAKGALSNGTQA